MGIAINQVTTFSAIPSFVPYGVLYLTLDTDDLYIGTGSSQGPAVNIVSGGGGGGGVSSITGDGTVISNSASTGAVTLTLETVSADTLLAGPTHGNANATPTFRALQDYDVVASNPTGSGSVASVSAGGNLIGGGLSGDIVTLDANGNVQDGGIQASTLFINGANTINAGGTVSLKGTSAQGLLLQNPTAASSGSNRSSSFLEWEGTYWNGSASNNDTWTVQDVLGAGTNPTSTLTFSHGGSTGALSVSFPSGSVATNALAAGALPNGTTATTQPTGDTSTDIATDAFVANTFAAPPALGNTTPAAVNATSLTVKDTSNNIDLVLQNTTAGTSGSTNASPIAEFEANYYTGSASAADTWQIGSALASGTNGASTLTLSHSGSTGAASVNLANATGTSNTGSLLVLGSTSTGIGLAGSSESLLVVGMGGNPQLKLLNGSTVNLELLSGSTSNVIQTSPNNSYLILEGSVTTGTNASVQLSNSGTFDGTSGTQILVSSSATFNPTSGSATFYAFEISPTIEGTSSGNTTALYVNPTITTTNLTGTNMIAVFASGGTQKAAIDYNGNYYSGSTVGVSAGSFSSISAITTVGGIVTQLTGSSDERLKTDITSFNAGLEAVLNIHPKKYKWNEAGRQKTGFSEDQEFAGFTAQDVQKAIPEAITGTEGPEKYLSFDDRPIIAALVNAVKELKAEIEALKAK